MENLVHFHLHSLDQDYTNNFVFPSLFLVFLGSWIVKIANFMSINNEGRL